MIEQIKIDKIYRNTERKDGTPYTTRDGKAFTLVTIKSGDKSYSYCDFNNKTAHLQEGETVPLLIEQNGDFLNFKLPYKTDFLEVRVEKLEKIVTGLYQKLNGPVEKEVKEPESDLPF